MEPSVTAIIAKDQPGKAVAPARDIFATIGQDHARWLSSDATSVSVGISSEMTGRRQDRSFACAAYLDLLRMGTEFGDYR